MILIAWAGHGYLRDDRVFQVVDLEGSKPRSATESLGAMLQLHQAVRMAAAIQSCWVLLMPSMVSSLLLDSRLHGGLRSSSQGERHATGLPLDAV